MANPIFTTPRLNPPFGLTHTHRAKSTFADIDGDGDLDALVGNIDGNTLYYRNQAITLVSIAPTGGGNAVTEGGATDTYTVGEGRHTGGIQHTAASINDLSLADPIFSPPGTNPFGLTDVGFWASPTLVDIDGDGDLDAFVGERYGNTLFYRNTGNASNAVFAAEASGLTDVGFAASPTLVDIDGDGDLDAFVGNFDGNMLFYRNTGTASSAVFAAAVSNPFGLSDVGFTAKPTFVDIDGDGDWDAFVGNNDGNTRFYRNTGNASTAVFAAPVDPVNSPNPFGLTDVGFSASPTFADIDGDGDLDALVGNQSGNTLFFRNIGNVASAAFAAPVSNPFGLTGVGGFASPSFADIDGDGDLDAFVGNYYGNTYFYLNNAPAVHVVQTGGKTAATEGGANDTYTVTLNTAPTANVTINLDTTNHQVTGSVSSLTFTPANWNTPQTVTVTAVNDSVGEGTHTGVIQHTATSADPLYNGLAITNVRIAITDNDLPVAAPIFNSPVTNPFGLTDVGSRASPTFADIDADGDLDAFVGNAAGNMLFYYNTGNAGNAAFVAIGIYPLGLTDVGYVASPTFADIDGDGDLDAFVGNAAGNTLFYRNTGNASFAVFAPPVSNPFGLTDVGISANPTFADIDADGDWDAFVGNQSGNTLFYRNTGTSSSAAFVAPPVGTPNPFGLTNVVLNANPTFADIDGDGDLDAFINEWLGNTLFYRNTGTANIAAFAAPVSNPFGLTRVSDYTNPTFADIDGDGDLDAFIGERFGNTLFYRNGNANTAPSATNLTQTVPYTEDITAAIADSVITDPDVTNTFSATVTLAGGNSAIGTLSAGSGNGETYTAATGVWAVTGTKAAVNAALAAMSFIPVANGFTNTSASVSISDGIAPVITGTLTFNGTSVNDAPTLTAFATAVASGNEDNQVTVTFANLKNQGNEADIDGTVTAFVVKAVSSGSLKIGATAATATAWSAASNNAIDATHKAFWTPTANANGLLNAFTAVAKDNGGLESATAIQATVNVTAVNDTPALTAPTAITYTDTVFDDTFATATGPLVASDIDLNALTYSITDGTDNGDGTISKSGAYGVLTVTKATGAYSFAPNDAAIEALTADASANFTVTASDSVLSDSKTLTIGITQNGTTESIGNNTLTGTSGNNKFNGLAGADTMIGGLGNDNYTVDDIGDVVTETSNLATEIDKVFSSISYKLTAYVENLTLTGTAAINGTGNTLNNVLNGNTGANILNGGTGADKLIGGLGNDSLIGGLGKDNLTGGLGADKFKFNAVAETGITATTRDIIVDFSHSLGDKINLSTIDADIAFAGNNAFSAPTVGGTFSGVFANPGELYFDLTAHILYGNNDADSTADFSIQLTGVASLVAADFVL